MICEICNKSISDIKQHLKLTHKWSDCCISEIECG
jgi:hypothetical protein